MVLIKHYVGVEVGNIPKTEKIVVPFSYLARCYPMEDCVWLVISRGVLVG